MMFSRSRMTNTICNRQTAADSSHHAKDVEVDVKNQTSVNEKLANIHTNSFLFAVDDETSKGFIIGGVDQGICAVWIKVLFNFISNQFI